MALTTQYIGDGLVKLSDEKGVYTGIASGLPSKIFRSVDLGALQSESGWIIDREGRMESWKISGVTEKDNQMVFYGPELSGKILNPEDLREEELILIGKVFHLVQEKNIPIQGFFSRAWFLTDDTRILVFPAALMDFIRKGANEETKLKCYLPYNHPDKHGNKGLAFTLAVLVYRNLSGVLPFDQINEVEIFEEIRTQPVIPSEIRIPGLKEPLADIINRSLDSKQDLPGMNEWDRVLDFWEKESPCEPLNTEQKEAQQKKLEEMTARRESRMSLRIFWRKKRTIVIAAVAAAVCLVAAVYTPVKKAFEPPLTMGMTPMEVVDAYYGSIQTMDQEMMTDCIHKDAGKNDIKEVMNFFVTSRVRQGYEGNDGLLSAEEWTAEGRPMPEPGITVFGLTGLIINPVLDDQFLVTYEKWYPGTPDEEEEDFGEIKAYYPRGFRIRDNVTLEQQKKGNWLITRIDRFSEDIPRRP